MPAYIIKNDGELPALPGELSYSDVFGEPRQFGTKIVEVSGEFIWEVATEEDFRASEAERLGIKPSEVRWDNCKQTGPTTCQGTCVTTPKTWCERLYNPEGRYYYCACV